MTTYSFNKSPISVDRLTVEIRNSSISVALDHILLFGTQLDCIFKNDLSESEQSILANIVSVHSGIPLVENVVQTITVNSIPAFASKTFGTKNLFKRVVGKKYDVGIGDTVLLYMETFPWVKFMSLEIIGGEIGDTCSLYILDTATGTFSGYPNAPLNQFGFDANIAPVFYQHKSEFDADIYAGLQIKIVYTSISEKKIGINYVMNEVK